MQLELPLSPVLRGCDCGIPDERSPPPHLSKGDRNLSIVLACQPPLPRCVRKGLACKRDGLHRCLAPS